MKNLSLAAVALAAAFALAGQAQASSQTYDLKGTIDAVFDTYGDAPLGTGIVVGDAIDLRVTYDPAAIAPANFIEQPATQVYAGALRYSVIAGSYVASGEGYTAFYVSDNAHYAGSTDLFDQVGFNVDGFEASPDQQPFDLGTTMGYRDALNFGLTDSTASAVHGFSFPLSLKSSLFNASWVDLTFNTSDAGVIARADNLSFTELAPVSDAPEPSLWLLMVGGCSLMGMALRGRRMVRLPHSCG